MTALCAAGNAVECRTTAAGGKIPFSKIPAAVVAAVSEQLASAPISSVGIAGSPISSVPISSVPISSVGITGSPISSVPISSVPISSVGIAGSPISSVPISSVPISSVGGWGALLKGTRYEDLPQNQITLQMLIDDRQFPQERLRSLTLGQLVGSSNWLANFSVAAILLGSTSLGQLRANGWSCGGDPLCASNQSLFALEAKQTSFSSAPISSAPISSVPISSVPISSVPFSAIFLSAPISSVPISSVPISSVPLTGSPISSVAISSVPFAKLKSAPISSVPISSVGAAPGSGYSSFCEFALKSLNEPCDPSELLGAYVTRNSTSAFRSIPISSVPISSVPISSVPISSVPISSVSFNGVPISSVPISSVALRDSPISSVPISSVSAPRGSNASTFCAWSAGTGQPCGAAQTIGDYVKQNPITEISLAMIAENTIPRDLTFGALFPSDRYPQAEFTYGLGFLFGYATVGEIYANEGNLDSLTLGDFIVSILVGANFPWERVPAARLAIQDQLPADVVHFNASYLFTPANGSGLPATARVTITLPDGFLYKRGSASAPNLLSVSQAGQQVIVEMSATAHEIQTVSLEAYASYTIGDASASATVVIDGVTPATTVATVQVEEEFEPGNNRFAGAQEAGPGAVYLTQIGKPGDTDWWRVDVSNFAPGSELRAYLNVGGLDLDMVMYRPAGASALTSAQAGPPRQQQPVADQLDASAGVQPMSSVLAPVAGLVAVTASNYRDLPGAQGETSFENEAMGSGPIRSPATAGPHYVRVSGHNGASGNQPYSLRFQVVSPKPTPVCPATSFAFPNDTPTTTLKSTTRKTNALFVLDSSRLARSYGRDEADALLGTLNGFAASAAFGVQFLDLSRTADFAGGYELNPCDPNNANITAKAIAKRVADVHNAVPGLDYLVIVGGDAQVPFFRVPDMTFLSNESDYASDLADARGGEFGAAASRQILTDDPYGDFDPIPWMDRYLYVPDISIGRLVETPDEMSFALRTFEQSGGTLDARSSTATGYDFLLDSASEIARTLAEQPWSKTRVPGLLDDLWAGSHLKALLAALPSITSLNAHFTHYQALPADQLETSTRGTVDPAALVTTRALPALSSTTVAVPGLIFSMGCHAGLNVNDLLYAAGMDPRARDWAQAFVSRGAILVGNTGYGYGDTGTKALSEQLMIQYAQRLDGQDTAGQAFVGAKQSYYKNLGDAGVYDEKILMETVFYGLPMYRIGAAGIGPRAKSPVVLPLDPPTFRTASIVVSPRFSPGSPTAGVRVYQAAQSSFASVSQPSWPAPTPELGSQATHYRPIEPRLSLDVTQPGLKAHGALITSLSTLPDSSIDPTYAFPVSDLSAHENPLRSGDAPFPAQIQTVNTFTTPDGVRQQLVLVTGQFIPDNSVHTAAGTQRLFDSIGVQIQYSTDTTDYSAPDIATAQAGIAAGGGAGNLSFSVAAVDLAANGSAGSVTRVVVLYRIAGPGNNPWAFLELARAADGTFTGKANIDATASTRVEWFAQAVDGSGNVSVSSNKGTYFQATPPLPRVTLTTAGPPTPSFATWATFQFEADQAGARFECQLDSGPFEPCTTFKTYFGLAAGPHRFGVRVVSTGGTNPTAAWTWEVSDTGPPSPPGMNLQLVCAPEGSTPFGGHRCLWIPQ